MEKVNDQVSIVTICRNCRDDLEKTIRSVLSQDYAGREFIVVDGSSTDGSDAVLARYASEIDVLISEPDDGIYDALNKGVRRASGEWIICMNAGDTFTSEHVLSDIFSKPVAPDTSFLYSDFYLLHADGRKELRHTDRSKGEVHHQNAIYRKRLHDTYGYYIVTKPYTVSDLLFFLAVPESQYMKVDTIIANVKAGGISDKMWCVERALAARAVYGMESITGIFLKVLRMRLSLWVHNIKKKTAR